jgi:hypothetical protein
VPGKLPLGFTGHLDTVRWGRSLGLSTRWPPRLRTASSTAAAHPT